MKPSVALTPEKEVTLVGAPRPHKGRPVPTFTDPALQVIRSYIWPGNVRELQNVIQRLVVMSPHVVIEASDLPARCDDGRIGGAAGKNRTTGTA